jgi:hypothetical protein
MCIRCDLLPLQEAAHETQRRPILIRQFDIFAERELKRCRLTTIVRIYQIAFAVEFWREHPACRPSDFPVRHVAMHRRSE